MTDEFLLAILIVGVGGLGISKLLNSLSPHSLLLVLFLTIVIVSAAIFFAWTYFSKNGRDNRKRIKLIKEIPSNLLVHTPDSVFMGRDLNLDIPVYLPDLIRSRHVHIIGSTGSGKTESVILNFLKQDLSRGLGSIILDAKGDTSFTDHLSQWLPAEKLKIFDLGTEQSLSYDPLKAGKPLEACQRLFSSLQWSEEYYKSKAFSALQKLFQRHYETSNQNPTLADLDEYLDSPSAFITVTSSKTYPKKLAEKDYLELSGLRDQIRSLCTGHLKQILSPLDVPNFSLEDAYEGNVLYFKLQSLMSPQIVSTLGKLIINHLSYLAGTSHRRSSRKQKPIFIPTYLDEFASFACPEFADLISKARSAGLALHFSHQSIGDLVEVSKGFLNRITDNSATKIILRINDPDSAEFFARSFGTKLYQKITQRITNVVEIDTAEVVGEGTQREAHQFRAAPDLFKTLPTGTASVLIAHGEDTPHGASTVFKIKFEKLKEENNEK